VKVAVVDAYERRRQFQGPVKLRLVVNFDEDIEVPVLRHSFELMGEAIVDHRHDQQNAIGAPDPGFQHLIGVKHEILAEGRE